MAALLSARTSRAATALRLPSLSAQLSTTSPAVTPSRSCRSPYSCWKSSGRLYVVAFTAPSCAFTSSGFFAWLAMRWAPQSGVAVSSRRWKLYPAVLTMVLSAMFASVSAGLRVKRLRAAKGER